MLITVGLAATMDASDNMLVNSRRKGQNQVGLSTKPGTASQNEIPRTAQAYDEFVAAYIEGDNEHDKKGIWVEGKDNTGSTTGTQPVREQNPGTRAPPAPSRGDDLQGIE